MTSSSYFRLVVGSYISPDLPVVIWERTISSPTAFVSSFNGNGSGMTPWTKLAINQDRWDKKTPQKTGTPSGECDEARGARDVVL